ncbi:type IVB secretion system protein IcmH/DotU [Rhizobium sp. ZK1]|uniref:type IVB secretion system protein IcmH/DotU n=1 Tax=Rhizobium sp. ZK1 TaxID=3389872 RepID=UPI0039F695C5
MSEEKAVALQSPADETIVLPLGASYALKDAAVTGGRKRTLNADRSMSLDSMWRMMTSGRACPLVAAASPLLDLCASLTAASTHDDVEQLRLHVLREISRFEIRVAPLQLTANISRVSKYVLCATMDDLVLNTTWGSRSIWTKRSLVATVFSETWGGDRFFDILAQLKKEPHINVDVLELMYYCICLGFEGRYRVAERGTSELASVRDELYRLLRTVRGKVENDISPHWQGIASMKARSPFLSPLLVTVVLLLALAGLYAALSISLANRKVMVVGSLLSLPPSSGVTISRAAPAPPERVVVLQADRLRRFLEREIEQGLVAVKEDAQTITVLIRGKGMFESASETVIADFNPLLVRIGEALNDQPGDVVVAGHTDNTPIRSQKFPSNVELSMARANTVAAIMASRMKEPARLKKEGRGDKEPIARNDSVEGRQMNRRIELIVTKETAK